MTPLRALYKGMNQLKSAAADALANPSGNTANAFKQLGINAAQLRAGLVDPNTLLGEVSDKLNEIGDDAQRQTASTEIFKANAFALAGLLELTSEEQKKLLTGHSVMSSVVIAQNAAMEDTWGRFWDAIKVGMGVLGLVLNPIIQAMSILLNIISILAIAVGGGLYSALVLVGGVIIAIVGGIGYLIGGIIKAIGWLGKFMGLGDGLEKFGDDWMNMSKVIMEGGLSGSVKKAKSTMKAGSDAMLGDVDDIKRAGGNMVAGYGSASQRTRREGTRTFKDPAEEQKKIDEANKAQAEALKARGEAIKNERDSLNELAKIRLKAAMEAQGASEVEITNALLRKDIELARNKLYAATGNDALKYGNEIRKLELQIVENVKKAKLAADEAVRKKRMEHLQAEVSLIDTLNDIGSQLKIQGMKKAGASESQIANAQFQDELDKAEKLDAEYKAALAARGGKEDATTTKMRDEAVAQQGKVVLAAGEAQLKGRGSIGVMADTMRKIGGGGSAISTGGNTGLDLTKKQLEKVTSMDENIRKLVEIASKTGVAVGQTAREDQIAKMAGNGLGSDNKPK